MQDIIQNHENSVEDFKVLIKIKIIYTFLLNYSLMTLNQNYAPLINKEMLINKHD